MTRLKWDSCQLEINWIKLLSVWDSFKWSYRCANLSRTGQVAKRCPHPLPFGNCQTAVKYKISTSMVILTLTSRCRNENLLWLLAASSIPRPLLSVTLSFAHVTAELFGDSYNRFSTVWPIERLLWRGATERHSPLAEKGKQTLPGRSKKAKVKQSHYRPGQAQKVPGI